MRIMNARNFRREFTSINEPVMVISKEKVVGTWQPGTTEPTRTERQATMLVDKIGPVRALGLDEDPVPGGTTAIRKGQYVREKPEPIVAEGSLGAIAAVQRSAKRRLGEKPVLFGAEPSFGSSKPAPKATRKKR